MKNPNRNANNTCSVKLLERRLLLEQLENRQLLAGDLGPYAPDLLPPLGSDSVSGVVVPRVVLSSSSPPQLLRFTPGDMSPGKSVNLNGNSAQQLGVHSWREGADLSRLNASKLPGNHLRRQEHGDHSQEDTNRQGFQLTALGAASSFADRPIEIHSRMTDAALLPALPPGVELIERITVTQSSALPLGSNNGETSSRTEVAVLLDNNAVPPALLTFSGKSGQELASNITSGLDQKNALRGEGEGDSVGRAAGADLGLASTRDSALAGGLFDDADDAARALDEALNQFFPGDSASLDEVAEQISQRVQTVAQSSGQQASVAAFVDSISVELRRKGMSEQQAAELATLIKQIVQADPALRESGTFVTSGRVSWTQYSRSDVQVYDFTHSMMAVPIDNSMLAGDPIDALVGAAGGNAWTQRFGLADVALNELGSYADGTELGRTPFDAAGQDADVESGWNILPIGARPTSLQSTLGKVGVVALACLANARLHDRSATRKSTSNKPISTRPRRPR